VVFNHEVPTIILEEAPGLPVHTSLNKKYRRILAPHLKNHIGSVRYSRNGEAHDHSKGGNSVSLNQQSSLLETTNESRTQESRNLAEMKENSA